MSSMPAADQSPLALVAARRGRWAWLEIDSPGCQRCNSGVGCGASLLGRKSRYLLRVEADSHWGIGTQVELPELKQPLHRVAWLAYGAPLMGLIAGLIMGAWMSWVMALGAIPADLLTLLGAAAGTWLGSRLFRQQSAKAIHGDCPL